MTLPATQEHFFPRSIDINPTAICNLHCSFCWGPSHTIPDGLSTEDWKQVIYSLIQRGTEAIVFTGGEPLVRRDIDELIRFAKKLGVRITLSTNTLLLRRRANTILPFIDEIGIPLDGSNTQENSRMRLGNARAFEAAIDAMKMVRELYPHIEITIRTVVSQVNKRNITAIGMLLERYQNSFNRWKIYHFTPVSIGAENSQEHAIGIAEFNTIVSSVKSLFPHLNITSLSHNQRIGRYIFIGPDGNIFGVSDGVTYTVVGTWRQLLNNKLDHLLEQVVDLDRNLMHAHIG